MDLGSFVAALRQERVLAGVALEPRAQFGIRQRRYIAASLLPERLVPDNAYTEEQIQYRTIVANAGTRYSPVQKKKGVFVGGFDVKLADSDVGSEFTSRDYDVLLRLLQRDQSMSATAQIVRWSDVTLNRPLLEWNERARWQAIVDANVLLRGDNDYTEDVAYSNPAGHRVNAAGTWSDDTYDPYDDIFAQAQLLASKGFTVGRMFASRKVVAILGMNAKVRSRTNRLTISPTGQITPLAGRASLSEINAALASDGLPPIELYDEIYRTNSGTGRFLPDDVLVMVALTGRDEALDLGDVILPIQNILGYTAIGRSAGQATPGRHIRVQDYDNKPPRIEGEAWQTSLPVILEPEAIAVIKAIA